MSLLETRRLLEDSIRAELASNDQGILMSHRVGFLGGRREDNNLFFTLSAYFLLKTSDSSVVSDLEESIIKNLEDYRNKEGRSTYNFWRTSPYEQFPGSRLFSKIKHFWVPDDLDCSALGHQLHSVSEIERFRSSIAKFTSKSSYKVGGLKFTEGFYTTWLGLKMPAELDVCVLANYLIILHGTQLELNSSDVISYNVVKEVIRTEVWLLHPFQISPNYQSIPIVAFHLSRFVSAFKDDLGAKLVTDYIVTITNLISKTDLIEDQIILELALQYLNKKIEAPVPLNSQELDKFMNEFVFFKAPMLSNSNYALVKSIEDFRMFNLSFCCKGFNAALLLKRMSHLE